MPQERKRVERENVSGDMISGREVGKRLKEVIEESGSAVAPPAVAKRLQKETGYTGSRETVRKALAGLTAKIDHGLIAAVVLTYDADPDYLLTGRKKEEVEAPDVDSESSPEPISNEERQYLVRLAIDLTQAIAHGPTGGQGEVEDGGNGSGPSHGRDPTSPQRPTVMPSASDQAS